MNEEILDKGIIHTFCDYLGFEEGKFYFSYLNNKNHPIDSKEYSHSKKYRILNRLYELGVLVKIGNDDLNTKYFLLPPTFIGELLKDKKMLDKLESIYLKNHQNDLINNLTKNKYLSISFRGQRNNSLILFLLKYYMKKEAIVIMGGTSEYEFYKKNLDSNKLDKIRYYCREDHKNINCDKIIGIKSSKVLNRRIVIIDEDLLIEFLKFPNPNHYENPADTLYMGYIIGKDFEYKVKDKNINYIKQTKKEIEELISLK